jgi:hypothetical protein
MRSFPAGCLQSQVPPAAPGDALSPAAEFEPRLMEETGASISCQSLIGLLSIFLFLIIPTGIISIGKGPGKGTPSANVPFAFTALLTVIQVFAFNKPIVILSGKFDELQSAFAIFREFWLNIQCRNQRSNIGLSRLSPLPWPIHYHTGAMSAFFLISKRFILVMALIRQDGIQIKSFIVPRLRE